MLAQLAGSCCIAKGASMQTVPVEQAGRRNRGIRHHVWAVDAPQLGRARAPDHEQAFSFLTDDREAVAVV
jgi:hypothetical protein